MASKLIGSKYLAQVRAVLMERLFTEKQIDKIMPHLHEQHLKEPKYLAEIVDTWDQLLSSASASDPTSDPVFDPFDNRPRIAEPPKGSLMGQQKINMRNILADIEPDLLLFDPTKLRHRHARIQGLGVTKNLAQNWLILFYSPRGFYLQDWIELTKKIYYIDNNIIPFLYDKRVLQAMDVHPIIKQAYVVEADFDHIRTRYLFAQRSGFKELSHMFKVQTSLDRQTIGDLVMSNREAYMKEFAPSCTLEEYTTFENLMKRENFDEDDAEIIHRLAELNEIRYNHKKRFDPDLEHDSMYT